MPPLSAPAVRAATLDPARYAGREADFGTVEAGKVADLVLLDANPFADITNTQRIRAVAFGGNIYDRAALDEIQSVVRRRARSWSVGAKILWRFAKSPARYGRFAGSTRQCMRPPVPPGFRAALDRGPSG